MVEEAKIKTLLSIIENDGDCFFVNCENCGFSNDIDICLTTKSREDRIKTANDLLLKFKIGLV